MARFVNGHPAEHRFIPLGAVSKAVGFKGFVQHRCRQHLFAVAQHSPQGKIDDIFQLCQAHTRRAQSNIFQSVGLHLHPALFQPGADKLHPIVLVGQVHVNTTVKPAQNGGIQGAALAVAHVKVGGRQHKDRPGGVGGKAVHLVQQGVYRLVHRYQGASHTVLGHNVDLINKQHRRGILTGHIEHPIDLGGAGPHRAF